MIIVVGNLVLSFPPSREENGNQFHHSYLENPVDRGAWLAADHGVTNSWTPLSDQHFSTLDRSDLNRII